MKKTTILFIAVLALNSNVFSQNFKTVEDVHAVCNVASGESNSSAKESIEEILSVVGLFPNFKVQQCPKINNALAKNVTNKLGNKERFILYDNEFFDRITQETSNDWAAISILAHEVGHHLNGHALNDEGSKHQWELDADEFSGFVLARMGSSLEDAQSALSSLKNEKATATHPAKADRLAAVEKGWKRGSGQLVTDITITEEDIKNAEDDPASPAPSSIVDSENKKLAQKVLAKYVEAIGGEENILKIRSLRTVMSNYMTSEVLGKESTNVAKMTVERATPSLVYTKMEIENFNTFSLVKDGEAYIKKERSAPWGHIGPDPSEHSKQASFIFHHSLLVRNEDVAFLGEETINGKKCYAIRSPKKILETNTAFSEGAVETQQTHYFNSETGLLELLVTDSTVKTLIKANNQSTVIKGKNELYFEDYKPVEGVLFPFKTKQISYSSGDNIEGTSKIESVAIYDKIQVNPALPREHFIIN